MAHLSNGFLGKNEWWRYLITMLLAFVGAQLLGSIPLLVVILPKIISQENLQLITASDMLDFAKMGINPNFGLVLMLLPFVCNLIAFYFLLPIMHSRSLTNIINGGSHIRWHKIGFGFMVWAGSYLALFFISYLQNPENFTLIFSFKKWVMLMIISALLLPIQTAVEEIIFRGYLAQSVGILTKSKLWVIALPSLLFGLMHATNPEVAAYGFWQTMPQYIIIGIILALVATLDDGIEMAIGIHAANNIVISLLCTSEHSVLQTNAIFSQKSTSTWQDYLGIFIMGALILWAGTKRYHWRWQSLAEPIKEPQNGF